MQDLISPTPLVKKEPVNEVGKSRVRIEIQMNGYIFIFGVPLMITTIILGSMIVFYFVGGSRQQAQVALPMHAQAPQVSTEEVVQRVMKEVPALAKALVSPVNVNVQPADVKVPETKVVLPEMQPRVYVTSAPQEAPNVNVSVAGGDGKSQTVTKVVEKIVEKEVAIYVPTEDKAQITINDLFPIAERFVGDYCKKCNLDVAAEDRKWMDAWNSRVKEEGDEQVLANRVLIEKRESFNVEKAKPEQVVEACRLMLRYRDAKLSLPTVFKENVTAGALLKIKRYLETGIATAANSVSPAKLVKSE
ncbi:MAG: hypothetical protein HY291_23545 [Planctomycetes bacterium]|nr:hypothetical protein [Planctomycetota bacterium]